MPICHQRSIPVSGCSTKCWERLERIGGKLKDKSQFMAELRNEFNRWEELLTSLDEEQILTILPSSRLSIKDLIAHLYAWQQVSIAQLEAALQNIEPAQPRWLAGRGPESDTDRDFYNERIYLSFRDQPWPMVHEMWKTGFLHFLELAEAIPETDLLETGRFRWLRETALSDVLLSSYDHHHEHLELVLGWFKERKKETNR